MLLFFRPLYNEGWRYTTEAAECSVADVREVSGDRWDCGEVWGEGEFMLDSSPFFVCSVSLFLCALEESTRCTEVWCCVCPLTQPISDFNFSPTASAGDCALEICIWQQTQWCGYCTCTFFIFLAAMDCIQGRMSFCAMLTVRYRSWSIEVARRYPSTMSMTSRPRVPSWQSSTRL